MENILNIQSSKRKFWSTTLNNPRFGRPFSYFANFSYFAKMFSILLTWNIRSLISQQFLFLILISLQFHVLQTTRYAQNVKKKRVIFDQQKNELSIH